MADKYVKLDDVIDILEDEWGYEGVREDLEKLPTADVVEVKHGKWIKHEPNPDKMREFHKQGIGTAMVENSIFWTCSICGCWGTPQYKYCPNCGARMDEKAREVE